MEYPRKVRIKKGVKPYGGRVMTAVGENRHGKLLIQAPTRPHAFGLVFGGDVRLYRVDEVDELPSKS